LQTTKDIFKDTERAIFRPGKLERSVRNKTVGTSA